jgi:hypothetical protein
MSTLLGKWLRYLKDKELTRSIITGTYNIPANLDSATTLILKEIGKMGLRIMNREGKEIIITPEEFIQFLEIGRRIHVLVELRGILQPL